MFVEEKEKKGNRNEAQIPRGKKPKRWEREENRKRRVAWEMVVSNYDQRCVVL